MWRPKSRARPCLVGDLARALQEESVLTETTKAYKNLDFLNSRAARSIRIMCEFEEPRRRLRENHIQVPGWDVEGPRYVGLEWPYAVGDVASRLDGRRAAAVDAGAPPLHPRGLWPHGAVHVGRAACSLRVLPRSCSLSAGFASVAASFLVPLFCVLVPPASRAPRGALQEMGARRVRIGLVEGEKGGVTFFARPFGGGREWQGRQGRAGAATPFKTALTRRKVVPTP